MELYDRDPLCKGPEAIKGVGETEVGLESTYMCDATTGPGAVVEQRGEDSVNIGDQCAEGNEHDLSSTALEGVERLPRKRDIPEQRNEGNVHPNKTATPSVPGNSRVRHQLVDVCHKHTERNDSPLSTAQEGGQNSFPYPDLERLPRKRSSITEQLNKSTDVYTPNIVIFGETGVGKSSIVNLIADQTLARTSNDARGCTFQHNRYLIILDKISCVLWDTAGLDEVAEGTVPAEQAEANLKQLIQELARSGGIHLIIYCIRCTRLTRALKRNYDLFYIGICRKKVPIALVVTGLEYQKDSMETWWTLNKVTLQENGMGFDEHACVTTINTGDRAVQERRLKSRILLRELVVKYSKLPAWRTDPLLVSQVFPSLRSIFHGTDSPGNSAVLRKVTVSGSFAKFFPAAKGTVGRSTSRIGNRRYEFTLVDQHNLNMDTLRKLEDVGGVGAGVLVFYTSSLIDNQIQWNDINAMKTFYDVAGGQTYPVIVVLQGCDNDEVASACRAKVVSRYSDFHAHFIPFSGTDAQARLDELIERLCIEQIKVKASRLFRVQRYLTGAVRLFIARIVSWG